MIKSSELVVDAVKQDDGRRRVRRIFIDNTGKAHDHSDMLLHSTDKSPESPADLGWILIYYDESKNDIMRWNGTSYVSNEPSERAEFFAGYFEDEYMDEFDDGC